MKKKHLVEIKLGTFFLIAIILLFISLLSIKEVNFFRGTYPIKVKFGFVEGIRSPSPVRFCGVNVGEIDKVDIKANGESLYVMVKLKIQKGVKIPRNSTFFINSLSIFGEKYLEIFPPENKILKDYIKPKEVVKGVSPIPLFKIFENVNQTMQEVRLLVQDGEVKTALKDMLLNLDQASGNLKRILASVEKQEGTIGKLFYSDSLHTKAEEFIDELKKNPWKLLSKPRKKPTKLNRGKADGSLF